jgi:hypothetical protein
VLYVSTDKRYSLLSICSLGLRSLTYPAYIYHLRKVDIYIYNANCFLAISETAVDHSSNRVVSPANMDAQKYVELHLKPYFDPAGAAIDISVKLILKGFATKKGDVLCKLRTYPTTNGDCNPKYSGDAVSVRDDNGPLTISCRLISGTLQLEEWCVGRDTSGDITVEVKALPVPVTTTKPGSGGLRKDQGGLIGAGRWFLPCPEPSLESCSLGINWDISGCPAGTRAICSFGEGNVYRHGPVESLLDCIYMVGPAQSYPSEPPTSDKGFCGSYWFGNLPPNIDAVKDFNYKMFPRVSDFFKDREGSYRVFFRRVPKGFNEYGFNSSGLIDYDNDPPDHSDWELIRALNRLMIGSWARLDPEDDGTRNDWYTQGEL